MQMSYSFLRPNGERNSPCYLMTSRPKVTISNVVLTFMVVSISVYIVKYGSKAARQANQFAIELAVSGMEDSKRQSLLTTTS